MSANAKLIRTNYCHPNCEPLKNIVRLSRHDAFALAQKLASQNQGHSFYRFADFENYYALRIAQDNALHAAFLTRGGSPQTAQPLSFVVGESEYLRQWFGNGLITQIALSDVPDEVISFTLGDSGAAFDRTGSFTLLTKAELLAHHHSDSTWLERMQQQYHYIEAQLWVEHL